MHHFLQPESSSSQATDRNEHLLRLSEANENLRDILNRVEVRFKGSS